MADRVERRRRELGLTPGAFAELAQLTAPALAHVRAGHRRKYQDSTIFGVARALRWRTNWYESMLENQDPLLDDGVFESVGMWEDRGQPQLAAAGTIDISDLTEEDRKTVLDLVHRLKRP
jgi:hypothetical protein